MIFTQYLNDETSITVKMLIWQHPKKQRQGEATFIVLFCSTTAKDVNFPRKGHVVVWRGFWQWKLRVENVLYIFRWLSFWKLIVEIHSNIQGVLWLAIFWIERLLSLRQGWVDRLIRISRDILNLRRCHMTYLCTPVNFEFYKFYAFIAKHSRATLQGVDTRRSLKMLCIPTLGSPPSALSQQLFMRVSCDSSISTFSSNMIANDRHV